MLYSDYPCLTCNFQLKLDNSSGGSKEGRRGRTPPGGPNSFNFMQFLGNFGKIVCWRPPGSWRPLLGEILDPPLNRVFPYCTKLAMMAFLYYLNLLSVNSHIHFDSKYYVKCKFASTCIQLVTISNSIWSRTKMLTLPTLCITEKLEWYSKQEK